MGKLFKFDVHTPILLETSWLPRLLNLGCSLCSNVLKSLAPTPLKTPAKGFHPLTGRKGGVSST